MCHLQILHEKYKDKGLVILGFDFSDDKQIALDFLRENSATFPSKSYKPHGFGAVPRILEKVYDKIISKGQELTGIKKK